MPTPFPPEGSDILGFKIYLISVAGQSGCGVGSLDGMREHQVAVGNKTGLVCVHECLIQYTRSVVLSVGHTSLKMALFGHVWVHGT